MCIRDRLYCPGNGRPALDPVVMFKALFIGYLFGIRSERQQVREIKVNVAYCWFLWLRLTDGVFDASTLSQNRRRRYGENGSTRAGRKPSSAHLPTPSNRTATAMPASED